MGWVDFIPNIGSWVEFRPKIAGGVRRVGLVRSLRRCVSVETTPVLLRETKFVSRNGVETQTVNDFLFKKKDSDSWWMKLGLRNVMADSSKIFLNCLPFSPIIMEVEDALIWIVSTTWRNSFFHFHDYGRKQWNSRFFSPWRRRPSLRFVRLSERIREKCQLHVKDLPRWVAFLGIWGLGTGYPPVVMTWSCWPKISYCVKWKHTVERQQRIY